MERPEISQETVLFQSLKQAALQRCMQSKRRYMDELALVVMETFGQYGLEKYSRTENAELRDFCNEYVAYSKKMREAGMT
jgi:hypothetical protein